MSDSQHMAPILSCTGTAFATPSAQRKPKDNTAFSCRHYTEWGTSRNTKESSLLILIVQIKEMHGKKSRIEGHPITKQRNNGFCPWTETSKERAISKTTGDQFFETTPFSLRVVLLILVTQLKSKGFLPQTIHRLQ